MIWIITAAVVALVFWFNRQFDRKQAAANAPLWIPLAAAVAGQVKDNGLQGIYRGRLVRALIDLNNSGGESYYAIAQSTDSFWIYALKLRVSGSPSGKSWGVDCTGAEPQHFDGDEDSWRRVLAGTDTEARQAVGFDYFCYDAKKGELSGVLRMKAGVTLEADVKNLAGSMQSPPPPQPAVFAAQLDLLIQMAETLQKGGG